jgi:hypothetical protein
VKTAALALATAALIAGCGSSSRPPAPAASATGDATPPAAIHVSLRTHAGFRYTASVSGRGAQACLLQSFELAGPHLASYEHLTRTCGRAAVTGPFLIQATKPRTELILDRPAAGCGVVRIGARRVPIVCSTGTPILRLTVLPARAAGVTVHGVAGLANIDLRLPRSCRHVCERRLARG